MKYSRTVEPQEEAEVWRYPVRWFNVIIMTGFDASYAEHAGSLGIAKGVPVAGILHKPFKLAELRETFEAYQTPVTKIA